MNGTISGGIVEIVVAVIGLVWKWEKVEMGVHEREDEDEKKRRVYQTSLGATRDSHGQTIWLAALTALFLIIVLFRGKKEKEKKEKKEKLKLSVLL